MASCSDDSKIKIWDLRKGKALFTLYSHTGAVNSVDFSFAGDYFSTGGDDKNLLVWKSNFYDSRTREADFIEQKISTAKSVAKVQVSQPAARELPERGVVRERLGENVVSMYDSANMSSMIKDDASNLKVVEVEGDSKINANLDRIMNQMDKLFVMLKVLVLDRRTWRLE
jgi:WD40 repeat protein